MLKTPFPFHSHPLYIIFNSSGRTGASCGTFCETCICAEEDGTYKKKLTGKFIHLIIYKEYYTNVSSHIMQDPARPGLENLYAFNDEQCCRRNMQLVNVTLLILTFNVLS